MNRNGIVNFFHDHLRQAVENRYLKSSNEKREGYLNLARFYEARDVDDRVVSNSVNTSRTCLMQVTVTIVLVFY